MKALLKKLFPGIVRIRNRIYNYLAHNRFRNKRAEEVFTTIYNENHWSDDESKSGTGSNKINTQEVVNIVNRVIKELQVKSLLDIPCGDFNWMKDVSLEGVDYLGGDIVEALVELNSRSFSRERLQFKKLNVLESELPRVDLVFCRDCLVHFSYDDIQRAIRNIKSSGSKYLITTTFPAHSNHNIITGNWRPINLTAKPLNFPPPIIILNELTHEGEQYSDKSLAVWRVEDL